VTITVSPLDAAMFVLGALIYLLHTRIPPRRKGKK